MAKTKVRRRQGPTDAAFDAVTRGLQAIGRDEADRLLRAAGYDDTPMLEAVRSQNHVLYAVLCAELGLENTPQVRQVVAKNEMILLQLVHNAVALGIEAARGSNGHKRR